MEIQVSVQTSMLINLVNWSKAAAGGRDDVVTLISSFLAGRDSTKQKNVLVHFIPILFIKKITTYKTYIFIYSLWCVLFIMGLIHSVLSSLAS